VLPDLAPQGELVPVRPLDHDLDAYRDGWYDALEAFA
jgi:hypothetical protein